MSGMGEIVGDFIRFLYWAIGILGVGLVIALGVIVWLVFFR